MEKKNKTQVRVVYKKLTLNKDTGRLKVKGWRQAYHANVNQKKIGLIILVSDKADFARETIRNKEFYLIIKVSILEDNNP